MKKLISPIRLSLILASIVLLSACAEETKKKTDDDSDKEKIVKEEEIKTDNTVDEDVSFMLPSPIQIAAIFNRAGLEYKEGLINPASNVNKYNTKTARYLNFGVYSAEVGS